MGILFTALSLAADTTPANGGCFISVCWMDVSLKESKKAREDGWCPAGAYGAGRGRRLSGVWGHSAHQLPDLQVPSSRLARLTEPLSSSAHRSGCPKGIEQAHPAVHFTSPAPDSPPLTAGGGAEAQGASPSITQRDKPQILRSLSAPVMLKGKLAMAVVRSHSFLLMAVLAQDLLSDKSVVCSAATSD